MQSGPLHSVAVLFLKQPSSSPTHSHTTLLVLVHVEEWKHHANLINSPYVQQQLTCSENTSSETSVPPGAGAAYGALAAASMVFDTSVPTAQQQAASKQTTEQG
jgi:hypothetical protein